MVASCPVCGDKAFVLTKSDEERRKRIEAKIAQTKARLASVRETADAAIVKAAKPADCPWLILAACSS